MTLQNNQRLRTDMCIGNDFQMGVGQRKSGDDNARTVRIAMTKECGVYLVERRLVLEPGKINDDLCDVLERTAGSLNCSFSIL